MVVLKSIAVQCPRREALKEYISGFMDIGSADQLEAHLAECQACEQTIRDLESDPDTLLEPLRAMQPMPAKRVSPIDDAIDVVKRMIRSTDQSQQARLNERIELSKPIPFRSYDLGAYELIQPLGRGGMGAVFVARHKQLGKQVAIKLLPSFSAAREDVLARFQREIRAAGKMNHPSIVAATDAGEQDGSHYLVMELIDGLDLSRLARATGPMSIADACEMTRQAAIGLSYAHAQGIVHRDIKPSNLMLDVDGHVKILDFGLAQLSIWDEAAQDLTTVGQLMGTLDYMAPEQAERCGATDYRSDLYALGATLFRLLSGRPPLAASPNQSPIEKLRLLANERPPRLDTLRPDAPKAMVDLVAKILAYRPEDRPSSAAHIAELIKPFTDNANLISVLRIARNVIEKDLLHSKDLILPASDMTNSQNGVKSPRQILANEADRQLSPAAVFHPPRKGRRILVGLALFAFVILGGILITLEMQKGELIIESDVAGVHVSLVKDGKMAQELVLVTGENSTRIYAGEYQIVLDSHSDSVGVDKDGKFTIQSRKKQVASVFLKKDTSSESNASTNTSTTPKSDEPVYNGKTLSEWLDQLSRERSSQSIGESLVALRALTDDRTSSQISDAICAILPKLPQNDRFVIAQLPEGRINYGTIDVAAYEALRAANPRLRYAEVLASLFNSNGLEFYDATANSAIVQSFFASKSDFGPLLEWMNDHILTVKNPDAKEKTRLHKAAGIIRARILRVSSNEDSALLIETRAVELLKQCEPLSHSFWLSSLAINKWHPLLNEEILHRAEQAIVESDTEPKYVSQAALILNWSKAKSPDHTELTHALQDRFDRFVFDPQHPLSGELIDNSLVFDLVNLGLTRNGGELVSAQFASIIPKGTSGFDNSSTHYANDTIELLNLARTISGDNQQLFNFKRILEQTEDVYTRLVPEIFRMSSYFLTTDAMDSNVFYRHLYSPETQRQGQANVEVNTRQGRRGGGVRGGLGASISRWEVFTSHDLIGFFVHIKAAEAAGITLDLTALYNDLTAINNIGRGGRGPRGGIGGRGGADGGSLAPEVGPNSTSQGAPGEALNGREGAN